MASDVIDTFRQDRDLHIGATGVFVVEFETGGDSGDFAHGKGSWEMPDNLSGGVIGFGVEGPRCSHGRPFWQGVFLHGCTSFSYGMILQKSCIPPAQDRKLSSAQRKCNLVIKSQGLAGQVQALAHGLAALSDPYLAAESVAVLPFPGACSDNDPAQPHDLPHGSPSILEVHHPWV
jgi:hypothetical protein